MNNVLALQKLPENNTRPCTFSAISEPLFGIDQAQEGIEEVD